MSRDPLRRSALTLLVAGLLVAGCTSNGPGSAGESLDGELLAFELVQASDFVFEADPTDPGRGIFRVRTTEPMICAIVWGETTAFGRFNNSLAMNGTGILDHDVALPGAVTGATYYFQVQGTTADGGQYRSEVGTFTIPSTDAAAPAEPGIEVGENLALDATVAAFSSTFGPGWEAENAIDGDTASEWATGGDGDSGSITIDLGRPQAVAAVEFETRSMVDGTATTETYTVAVDDADPLGPFPASNLARPQRAEVSFTGQRITFDVATSTGGNVGAVEIRVFAPAGS